MYSVSEQIKNSLFALQDKKYKDFQSKLIPTVEPETIIGVRTPKLKSLAKSLKDDKNIAAFLKALPHSYYEENNLHAFIIAQFTDYGECISALDAFLPYIDNWATCDSLRPKCFKKHKACLLNEIPRWLSDDHTYTVRFGIEMLMVYFLEEDFRPEFLQWAAEIKSEEYYVNMMLAWYFATALAKQYDCTLPYITEYRLDKWVHNKTIQKAVESFRISQSQKALLKTFKI